MTVCEYCTLRPKALCKGRVGTQKYVLLKQGIGQSIVRLYGHYLENNVVQKAALRQSQERSSRSVFSTDLYDR